MSCIVTSVPISILQGRCRLLDDLTTLGFYRSNVPHGNGPRQASVGKVYAVYSEISILTALGKMLWANRNGF